MWLKPSFHIRCRTAPCGTHGPLLPLTSDEVNILMLSTADPAECPVGLTLDAAIIFDMERDGGVEGIEIFLPVGIDPTLATDFKAGLVQPRPREKYWRLFLETDEEGSGQDPEVGFERDGGVLTFPFGPPEIDSRYLVGPGITALVGNNHLRGISVDLTPLLILPRPKPKP